MRPNGRSRCALYGGGLRLWYGRGGVCGSYRGGWDAWLPRLR
jgi:hypothetical protein